MTSLVTHIIYMILAKIDHPADLINFRIVNRRIKQAFHQYLKTWHLYIDQISIPKFYSNKTWTILKISYKDQIECVKLLQQLPMEFYIVNNPVRNFTEVHRARATFKLDGYVMISEPKVNQHDEFPSNAFSWWSQLYNKDPKRTFNIYFGAIELEALANYMKRQPGISHHRWIVLMEINFLWESFIYGTPIEHRVMEDYEVSKKRYKDIVIMGNPIKKTGPVITINNPKYNRDVNEVSLDRYFTSIPQKSQYSNMSVNITGHSHNLSIWYCNEDWQIQFKRFNVSTIFRGLEIEKVRSELERINVDQMTIYNRF